MPERVTMPNGQVWVTTGKPDLHAELLAQGGVTDPHPTLPHVAAPPAAAPVAGPVLPVRRMRSITDLEG